MSNAPKGPDHARLVVNNLTRLRPSKRDRYRVAIFGSARAQPGTSALLKVKIERLEKRGGRLVH